MIQLIKERGVKMDENKLNKILELHKKWLNNEENGVNADFRGANLRGADLYYVKCNEVTSFYAMQCPEEGSFIGWKKASKNIVKLLIPSNAKRSSATSRKCRASKAEVIAIYDKNGNEIQECFSSYTNNVIYKVGETVYPDKYDENRWNECSNGIHFFITRQEAENYN